LNKWTWLLKPRGRLACDRLAKEGRTETQLTMWIRAAAFRVIPGTKFLIKFTAAHIVFLSAQNWRVHSLPRGSAAKSHLFITINDRPAGLSA